MHTIKEADWEHAMNNTSQYWKDVYKNKFRFASKKNGAVIPWDIKRFDPNLQQILDTYNLNQGDLLELGCGTGYDSAFLQTRGFNVSAIDISLDAIATAKQVTDKVNFIVGDFFHDLPAKQFDLIYDRGFLHNYKNKYLEIFEKLNHLLKENGKIIIITGNPNQQLIETCMPPPVFLGEIEYESSSWFKIVYVKEIVFHVDSNYEDCLGYIFLLEKRKSNQIYNR